MNSETNATLYPTTPVFVISSGRAAEEFRCSFCESPLFHQPSTRFETNLPSFLSHFSRVAANQSAIDGSRCEPRFAALDSWFAGILTNQSRYTLISMEYDSISRMPQDGRDEDQVPLFIRWLVENRFPTIHVVGNNPLDCFVERILSETNDAETVNPDEELAAFALQQISQMKSEGSRFREWLADGCLLEISYPALFNPMGAISRMVLLKLSHFLEVDPGQFKTGAICRRLDHGRNQAFWRMKRQLRPVLTRAGYEKLFDLPKAA